MPQDDGSSFFLDFEKPLEEIGKKIKAYERFSKKSNTELDQELEKYRKQEQDIIKQIYSNLTPWQRVNVARHPDRPDTVDYIRLMLSDFIELHGDKAYRDDRAVICGLGKIDEHKIMLIGQTKGKSVKEKQASYFGSMHPEGYRKALEKMKLAEKFHIPILTLVNTPGAYPGIGAEERGQANLIAKNLFEMSRINVPIISVIIGEGGSGGALGICLCDRLLMLENSYLSVISPEGCAAILWRDASKAPIAAQLLRITPEELLKLEIIDEIIPEPLGGAHREPAITIENVKNYVLRHLKELKKMEIDKLLEQRYQKYRKIGTFLENQNIVGKHF